MRWPWQRRADPDPVPAFDASVDIDVDGRDRDGVLAAVREAVSRLPGAGWVSVEPHPGAQPDVRLFPAGSSGEVTGAAWAELHDRVARTVRDVLAAWPKRCADAWQIPAPVRHGFAEALAPSQFDALAELAALAELSRAPKPKPLPAGPDSSGDIDRVGHLLGFV